MTEHCSVALHGSTTSASEIPILCGRIDYINRTSHSHAAYVSDTIFVWFWRGFLQFDFECKLTKSSKPNYKSQEIMVELRNDPPPDNVHSTYILKKEESVVTR